MQLFPFMKSVISVIAMGGVMYVMCGMLGVNLLAISMDSKLVLTGETMLVLAAAALTYLSVALLLKSSEMLFCLKTITKMLSNQKRIFLPPKKSKQRLGRMKHAAFKTLLFLLVSSNVLSFMRFSFMDYLYVLKYLIFLFCAALILVYFWAEKFFL